MGIFLAIDLKSFYASVECIEKGYDPLDTNLVVADASRTEKTICLAVSPSLKKYGISGRARLFEVIQTINRENNKRLKESHYFNGESYLESELKNDKHLKIAYKIATPRMSHYMNWSQAIYKIYLKYVSPEDIHVYSIDEVFMDITHYIHIYQKTPKELASQILSDIYETTGLIATAGIGTNLYLCKVAMDIVAKHIKKDSNGQRIALLNEERYRKYLWNHRPLTDFWRVGRGYAKKLEDNHIYTMGDIAKISLVNEDLLFKLFGVNAELLIDHAWGYEPCTISDAKNYKPLRNSISTGQVLHCAYDYNKARLVVREMADSLSLDLVDKHLISNQFVLTIGYDAENLLDPKITNLYHGEIITDNYGRSIPKHAHGTTNIDHYTSSTSIITNEVVKLYDKIINRDLLIKRINLTACNVVNENYQDKTVITKQLDLFSDTSAINKQKENELNNEVEERKIQRTLIDIKNKYGKNAILKGMNLEEGSTQKDRNEQVGGHRG